MQYVYCYLYIGLGLEYLDEERILKGTVIL